MAKYRVKITERHVGYVEVEAASKKDAEREAMFHDCDAEFECVVDTYASEIESD